MAEDITTIVQSLGFPTMDSFIALLLVALAIVGVIVVIVTIRPLLDTFPYAYPNARIRARMGRLFSEKQLAEIIESSNTEEIVNYLRGFPEYAKYVDQYSLEKALDTQLAETYDVLAKVSPDETKLVFQSLLKKWDIANIKSLITAKDVNLDSDKTTDLLIPFGNNYAIIEGLTDVNNVTDVVTGLESTEYSNILEDALSQYEDNNTVLPFESALDNYYLETILKTSANPSEGNSELIHIYIGSLVDTTNLKIILRAKADGLNFDDVSPYIISNGYQIRDWKLKDLMESDSIEGVISSMEGTDYSSVLSEALSEYSTTKSLSHFEKALNNYMSVLAKNSALKNQFGIGPMLGFLNRKETEIKNLKIIARAKRGSDFSNSLLKEMLS